MPEREVLRLGIQLAHGLHAAHEQGVVHRDLKPGNLRVTPDGRLKILDFGLARVASLVSTTTTTATADQSGPRVEGTPPYMAPEQLRAETIDERTDIYSAGVVLYEIATGRPPFAASQFVTLVDQILREPPEPPRRRTPSISPGLERVILKAIDKEPSRRYQSAKELAVDLERLQTPSAVLTPSRDRVSTWTVALATALVCAVLGLVAWVGLGRWRAGDAPRLPPALVVVADLDDRGNSPSMTQAVRRALAMAFQQSPPLEEVSAAALAEARQRLRLAQDAPLDADTVTRVALRDGYRAVIAGLVERDGGRWRVTLRAFGAVGRHVVAQRSFAVESGGVSSTAMVQMVAPFLADLRDAMDRLEPPAGMPRVTTSSDEALAYYANALRALQESRHDESQNHLAAAIRADDGFPMAHLALSQLHRVAGRGRLERADLARAFSAIDGVTPGERFPIEAAYFETNEEYDRALEVCGAWVGAFPESVEAREALARAYDNDGYPDESIGQHEKELELQIAQRLEPGAFSTIIQLLVREGRFPEAADRAAKAVAHYRSSGRPVPLALRWAAGMAAFGLDKLDDARSEFEALSASGRDQYGPIGELYLARLDIYRGRLDAAEERLLTAVAVASQEQRDRAVSIHRYLLGRIDLCRERPRLAVVQARSLATQLTADPMAAWFEQILNAGLLYVEAGDLPRARALLDQLGRQRPSTGRSSFARSCLLNLQGAIALATGRVAEAEQAFRNGVPLYPRYLLQIGLARTYARQRRWAEASRAWEQVIGRKGVILRDGFPADWLTSHVELARVRLELGDRPGARQSLSAALDRWTQADDLPVRRRATELWNTLAAAPGGGSARSVVSRPERSGSDR